MPFGLINAPEVYSRMMADILLDLQDRFCLNYMDDDKMIRSVDKMIISKGQISVYCITRVLTLAAPHQSWCEGGICCPHALLQHFIPQSGT